MGKKTKELPCFDLFSVWWLVFSMRKLHKCYQLLTELAYLKYFPVSHSAAINTRLVGETMLVFGFSTGISVYYSHARTCSDRQFCMSGNSNISLIFAGAEQVTLTEAN